MPLIVVSLIEFNICEQISIIKEFESKADYTAPYHQKKYSEFVIKGKNYF